MVHSSAITSMTTVVDYVIVFELKVFAAKIHIGHSFNDEPNSVKVVYDHMEFDFEDDDFTDEELEKIADSLHRAKTVCKGFKWNDSCPAYINQKALTELLDGKDCVWIMHDDTMFYFNFKED